MDDLLLFTPTKKAHMVQVEDLLKNVLKISPKSANYLKQSYNTWRTL